MPTAKTDRDISVTDDAALAEQDTDEKEDFGNVVTEEEEETDDDKGKKPPAKKAAKKSAAKTEPDEEEEEDPGEEEEEDPDEEEEEEEPEKDPAIQKLTKQLGRLRRARDNLKNQVDTYKAQEHSALEKQSEKSQERYTKLVEELDGLYEKVETLRAEGKTADAAKAQRRIDEIRDGMTRAQAGAFAAKQAVEAAELRTYNTMVAELQLVDPRFDPEHDDYDEDLLNDVNDLIEGYEGKGIPLPDALRRACKMVLREDVFTNSRTLRREEKKADGKKEDPKKKVDPKKTDVKKNLDVSKKQPPEEPGTRGDKATELPDMATISEKDFDALPESVQRRLYGNDG